MQNIYIGDSINVASRVKRRHCSGNVKTSVFRYHIAKKMGFHVTKEPRHSRNGKVYTAIFISGPYRRESEKQISSYVATGRWKFIECTSKEEAQDFQYYLIEKQPTELNVLRCSWDRGKEKRYAELYEQILLCPWTEKNKAVFPKGPGVYWYGNQNMPK